MKVLHSVMRNGMRNGGMAVYYSALFCIPLVWEGWYGGGMGVVWGWYGGGMEGGMENCWISRYINT